MAKHTKNPKNPQPRAGVIIEWVSEKDDSIVFSREVLTELEIDIAPAMAALSVGKRRAHPYARRSRRIARAHPRRSPRFK